MPLYELPTELDEQIIKFIDNVQDLSSMTQVSKYYRNLAEPFSVQSPRFPRRQIRQCLPATRYHHPPSAIGQVHEIYHALESSSGL